MVEICAKHENCLGLWIGEKPCFPCIWQEKPRSSRAPASPMQGAYPPVVTNFQKSVTAGLWTPKAFATCSPAGAIRRLPRCGRGGIGRRAALRSLWGNPWKFESSRPHQKRTRPSSRVFCCPHGGPPVRHPADASEILLCATLVARQFLVYDFYTLLNIGIGIV